MSDMQEDAPNTELTPIQDARYNEIARRVLNNETQRSIGRDMGISERHMSRIMHDPRFLTVYNEVSRRLFEDIDKLMTDEKAEPQIRGLALNRRAYTMASEIMEDLRSRMRDGFAKATELRVGVDLAFGIMDRINKHAPTGSSPTTNVKIGQLNLQNNTVATLREAILEAGVDLSDLTDPTPIEAETLHEHEHDAEQHPSASPSDMG